MAINPGCNGITLCDPAASKGCKYLQGKFSINGRFSGFPGPFQCQGLTDQLLKISSTIDPTF